MSRETQMSPIFESKPKPVTITREIQVSPIFESQTIKPVTITKETQVSQIFEPPIVDKKPLIIKPYNKEYTFLKLKLKLWIWVLIIILIIVGIIMIILWAAGVFSEKPADICKSYNSSIASLTQAYNDQNTINTNLNILQNQIKAIDAQISNVNNTISIASNTSSLSANIAALQNQLASLNTSLTSAQNELTTATTNLTNNTNLINTLNNFLVQAELNVQIEENINSDMAYINQNYSAASTCATTITNNNTLLGSTGGTGTGYYSDIKKDDAQLQTILDEIYPLSCAYGTSALNWIIPIIIIIIFLILLLIVWKGGKNAELKEFSKVVVVDKSPVIAIPNPVTKQIDNTLLNSHTPVEKNTTPPVVTPPTGNTREQKGFEKIKINTV